MNRIEHVEAQLSGDEGVEAYAARVGVDADELREWKTLYLAGGRASFTKAPARRKLWFAAAVAVAAVVPATVYAACGGALKGGLIRFCADEPAQASAVNDNFERLATFIEQRTGALDGGIHITQVNTSRLLSADNIVRIGGDKPWVQVQLDTSAGGSGSALMVDGDDELELNHNNSFTRTVVRNALAAGGAFTAENTATVNGELSVDSITPRTRGWLNVNGAIHATGELQGSSIRKRDCLWRGNNYVQRDADTGAACNNDEYAAGVSCRVPTTWYLACSVYCCKP